MKKINKVSNFIGYIIAISIYYSFLFFNKQYGINVILFVIPLLIFIYYLFHTCSIINNKKGLLFVIPIIVLSISYLLYDNYFFKDFNIGIMTLFFLMMYLYTIKPTFNLIEFGSHILKICFYPFSYIDKYCIEVKEKIESILKLSNSSKKKVKSFLIVTPVVFIVLLLLTSADMIFNNIFQRFFDVFQAISLDNILGRLILGLIFFILFGSTIYYLLIFSKEKEKQNKTSIIIDSYTIKLLLTILNIVYVLFDFIQIRSLIFHQGMGNIHYAQYARSGFFQLLFISIINIGILLLSKQGNNESKYNKGMGLLMVFLTFIIIVSSFLRMYMYESAYGYTLLRLLVYVSLFTEVLLLIPTILYIINSKVCIFKYYIIIITTMYCLLSLAPVDYIIANNNINRYYKTKKLDIWYLSNSATDNIPLLCEFYQKDESSEYRKTLKVYLNEMKKRNKDSSFIEFNISRNKAMKALESISFED